MALDSRGPSPRSPQHPAGGPTGSVPRPQDLPSQGTHTLSLKGASPQAQPGEQVALGARGGGGRLGVPLLTLSTL